MSDEEAAARQAARIDRWARLDEEEFRERIEGITNVEMRAAIEARRAELASAPAPSSSSGKKRARDDEPPLAAAIFGGGGGSGGGGSSGSSASEAQPAVKEPDLFGIVYGMKTYGKGRTAQINWDLGHNPVCLPTCKGYMSNRKCEPSCEQRIIRDAQKKKKK